MTLEADFAELRQGFLQYLPIGMIVGFIVALELILVVGGWTVGLKAPAQVTTPTPEGMSNTLALGRVIYTQYLVLFQAAGLVLLTAMVGAIVLTLRHKPNVKRQSIPEQNARSPKAVESRKVRSRVGV